MAASETRYYIMKSEPEEYAFADLVAGGRLLRIPPAPRRSRRREDRNPAALPSVGDQLEAGGQILRATLGDPGAWIRSRTALCHLRGEPALPPPNV